MISGRDVYASTALFGLMLFFAAVFLIAIALLIEEPAQLAFLLFFVVPGLVAGAALRFIKRWGLILSMLLGAFGFLILLEDVDPVLATPDAFFDFTATITALIGTIQYFRKQVGEGPGNVPVYLKAFVPVLVAIALISAVLTALQTDNVSAEDAQGATVVTASKTEWNVKTLDATAGEPIRFLVRNDDPLMHTFTIHDLDIDVTLGPWSETIVEVTLPRAGIYGFICRISGHEEDMTGAITAK